MNHTNKEYVLSENINFVSYGIMNKTVLYSNECYTEDSKIKQNLNPMRYEDYDYSQHKRGDNLPLGVALPSSYSEKFNGLICLDLDSRGDYDIENDVFRDVKIKLHELKMVNEHSVEYNPRNMSYHCWMVIDRNLHRKILKGEHEIKSKGKLYVSKESSIDVMIGGTCIRTSDGIHQNAYLRSHPTERTIQWDKLPKISEETLTEFMNCTDLFTKVSIKRGFIKGVGFENMDIDLEKEHKIQFKILQNVAKGIKIDNLIMNVLDLHELFRTPSYNTSFNSLGRLKLIGMIYKMSQEQVLEKYRSLFPRTYDQDRLYNSGLDRAIGTSQYFYGDLCKIETVLNDLITIEVDF